MAKTDLTAQELRKFVHYDPETGVFTWKVRVANRVQVGDVAGAVSRGYRRISILGAAYPAHRLAWLYVTNSWPENLIDHINGDQTDNRFSNLRDATYAVNIQNKRKPMSNNRTGYLGVMAHQGRFMAQIYVAGKSRYLGMFGTAAEAHQAYVLAKRKFHEGCTL
jgi:hypothetical protein